ncbi:RND transporter [Xanthomonas vasicola]|nr:RND transporter [Xanthomonas vasicola pv. musacearum NCPPB 4380]KFA13247.1 RND transporter [Xanthomonas vasicola pv. musacearum NCPPB 2005]KFA16410.1 RND transporter [Xanthomonas vasicola pv. musacearum NCPPB 4394]KFA19181.1 RND transporter [Xanthomonas vasicola pv. musacearum NCPPB 4384]KGR44563.1 RND transporter [Xanthomonas vasicola]
MLADATISVAERINVLKIPSEYLVPSAGGNEIPTFGAIQDAIKENFSTVGLTKRQQKSLETELVMKLPEQGIKSRVPSELVNFFGAAAASRIVVIDDESGDPVAAIRRDRKQRLGEKFFAFRSTLNSSQQLVWDQLLSDLVESRYASVLVKNGDKVIKRSILIGMNDDVSTQVFSGLATQDLIVLQINNFQ